MPQVSFDTLPDEARLWVFAAERPLESAERATLFDRIDRFIASWTAHGAPVVAGRQLSHARFLLVGVDERATGLSGCSIDGMMRTLQGLERELGVELVNSPPVVYRQDGTIQAVTRDDFESLVAAGKVTPETVVFDNTVATVGEYRAGRWETPARDAWHAQAFF